MLQVSVPAPPPYDFHADEDNDAEAGDDQDNFRFQRGEKDPELSIDEVSPDEDERTAEAALSKYVRRPTCSLLNNRFRSPAYRARSEGMSSCVSLR